MTPKPIPTPRNLKPGDIIVDNHGERHVFGCYDSDGDAHSESAIFRRDGYRYFSKSEYAVRIIRHNHIVVFPSRSKARAAAKAFGGKVQS